MYGEFWYVFPANPHFLISCSKSLSNATLEKSTLTSTLAIVSFSSMLLLLIVSMRCAEILTTCGSFSMIGWMCVWNYFFTLEFWNSQHWQLLYLSIMGYPVNSEHQQDYSQGIRRSEISIWLKLLLSSIAFVFFQNSVLASIINNLIFGVHYDDSFLTCQQDLCLLVIFCHVRYMFF